MASEIKVDTISEKTSAGGVTIDGLLIKDGGISGDVSLIGTTPTFTIGDAGAEDAALVFDGNAKDFYIALDDSADKLVIGEGSTVGTNSILTITDDSVTIGDAAAVDTKIVFDGNAKDFYIALDDSADKLVIGEGSTVGTNSIMTITDDSVTIGDASAVDTKLVFDGNAQDYYIGLDDSADDLVIGLGSAVVTISDGAIDFDIASHDTSNGLKLGGTLVTATAAELNLSDGAEAVASTKWQAIITGATTMVSGRGYFVNTTSSAFTMTLPASPTLGDGVQIIDYAGTFDSNTCTVGRNSQPIQGAAADMTVTTERAAFTLVYVDGTHGWLLTNK